MANEYSIWFENIESPLYSASSARSPWKSIGSFKPKISVYAVVQPLEELGYFAVDLILRELEKQSPLPVRMVMEPSIIERRSVASI